MSKGQSGFGEQNFLGYNSVVTGGGKMRLTTKLVLSFAGIIALLLLMSGVSFKSVSGMNASVTSVDTDIMPSVVAVQACR
jgi:CHASE3 domain sensor protein